MIHGFFVLRVVSAIVGILSGFMVIPLLIALGYGEGASAAGFGIAIGIAAVFALVIQVVTKLLSRGKPAENLTPNDGFLIVTLSWVLASVMGALPFWITGAIPGYADAFFETMSGFTTTGASILSNIEGMPRSLLFWRSLTHWMGGMGIVVFTVALLPVLGIGGMQLVRAEAPGPTVDRLSHRIANTAKILWLIYFGLTAVQTMLLMAGGMDWFDASTHSFATMATGGFSTRNTSLGAFSSPYIHVVVTIFMVLAGLNFSLYYRLMQGKWRDVGRNTEAKVYLGVFIVASLAVALPLVGRVYDSFGQALQFGAFQSASILTTTGFATADFDTWPQFSKTVLLALMFIGGSSGSTGGGIKVIRIVTVIKQAFIEMRYVINPKRVYRLRLNGQPVSKDFTFTIFGFIVLYGAVLGITTLVVASGGYDLLTSVSTALATVGNIGPGFNLVGPAQNYGFFPDYIKWFLSAAMLIGRLEVYTVLVILTPTFWRE